MQSDIYQVIVQSAMSLLYTLPVLAFIILAIYYISKVGSTTDGYLILIGNIIIFIASLITALSFLQITIFRNWEIKTYTTITAAMQVLSFIGKILFVIGVFLLLKKVIKNKKIVTSINH